MPVVSKTMTITPAQAWNWLETCNTHNRPLRQHVINDYTNQMKAGRWKLNGESIIFDSEGTLANGQHRLWACHESKASFECVVVTGVDPETFSTMDQGTKRSAADALYIDDKEHYAGVNRHVLSAAAMLVYQYRQDTLFHNIRLPIGDVLRLVKEEPDLIHWVKEASKTRGQLKGFATPVAACMFLGAKMNRPAATEFAARFHDGAGLDVGSPILTLRNRITTNPPNKSWERFFIVVSAWNAFATKRSLARIIGVPRGEDFPRIKGADS